MAGDKLKGVKLQGNSYWARMKVPKDVAHMFPTGELWENLHTGNPHDAAKMAPPILAGFKKLIADARKSNNGSEVIPTLVKMLHWIISDDCEIEPDEGASLELETPWKITKEMLRLEAIEKGSLEGGDAFDATVAGMLRASGEHVRPDHPSVAAARRSAASALLTSLKIKERARLVQAHEARAASLRGTLEAHVLEPVSQPVAAAALPPPSMTLQKLHDEWLATLTVVEKEKGRLNHQIRRLIEVVGDKPANHLTKADVREFMGLVARFPGRKRSAELNALPMRELIEKFEADNAAIMARNAAKKPGDAMEEVPATLRATTADEWFGGYRRMFEYGVDMDLIDRHPFEARIKKHAVKGAEPMKKREFTEAEIKTIFGAPLFNGFEGDGERGYRHLPGDTILRDAKYWLPILGLFHGGRLTEFAGMPHADLKQSPAGSWYFDLTTGRQVKNETSQRMIPLHPHMIKLGFLEYVAKLRAGNSPWLFPDLDHETKHGPGHAFSKWWGLWMDKHGLTDPSITHHSWRHTFKRAARQSDVKEELHDVITGHTNASVGRSYGPGADVEPLVREMAKITFPAFPAIPVLSVARADA